MARLASKVVGASLVLSACHQWAPGWSSGTLPACLGPLMPCCVDDKDSLLGQSRVALRVSDAQQLLRLSSGSQPCFCLSGLSLEPGRACRACHSKSVCMSKGQAHSNDAERACA